MPETVAAGISDSFEIPPGLNKFEA